MNILIDKHEYPYFHPGLGIMIQSKSHLKIEMRDHEEVGTEDLRKGPTKGLSSQETKDYYYELRRKKHGKI